MCGIIFITSHSAYLAFLLEKNMPLQDNSSRFEAFSIELEKKNKIINCIISNFIFENII